VTLINRERLAHAYGELKVHVSGRIVAVQEQRFRLASDSGQVYLLTLGRDVQLDAAELNHLKDTAAHVAVDYTGEPNLADGVAHSLRVDGRSNA
jgi:hypothetical protein